MKYEVVDIPQPENCEKCTPCLRLRLMEMGFITGERIELYMVNILTENDHISSVVALRQEELDRICLKGVL
jgi:Fe2+ transport system protein FeoA